MERSKQPGSRDNRRSNAESEIINLLKSENPDDRKLGLILLWDHSKNLVRSQRHNFCYEVIQKAVFPNGRSWADHEVYEGLTKEIRKIAKEWKKK